MATKRERLLAEIAAWKEERNQAILAAAPEDDVAAGQSDPQVRAIEAKIRALRDEIAALDSKEG